MAPSPESAFHRVAAAHENSGGDLQQCPQLGCRSLTRDKRATSTLRAPVCTPTHTPRRSRTHTAHTPYTYRTHTAHTPHTHRTHTAHTLHTHRTPHTSRPAHALHTLQLQGFPDFCSQHVGRGRHPRLPARRQLGPVPLLRRVGVSRHASWCELEGELEDLRWCPQVVVGELPAPLADVEAGKGGVVLSGKDVYLFGCGRVATASHACCVWRQLQLGTASTG